jgi:molybdopterin/thiamine biosynthesis adenylyltransferase
MPVQVIEVGTALEQRRGARLESSLLADASVAVIGLGTGGIHVAVELAKAGVGQFALVDADRLDVGNVVRHHAGVSHAGRRKVYVARDLILEKNPAARVEVHTVAIGPETEALVRGLIEAADLVIGATDGRPSKLFINRLAVAAGKPAIYAGAFRRAYGGLVLRVRPGISPCYQCFVMAMPEEEADREVASEADALEVAYSDRPVPIEPGLSLDVAPIGLMVAKLALNELLAGRETTLASLERDLAAPWYLWINRPEPQTPYAAWPPLSESSDEMTILRWYGIHFDREAGCPACGDFGAAVRRAYGLDEDLELDLPEPPSDAPIRPEEE